MELKKYVDLVLLKTKKAIDNLKIYEKVTQLILKENPDFSGLSLDDKNEIKKIIDMGCSNVEYYKTPNDKYISIKKTSFLKGSFYGNRNGDGHVTVTSSYEDRDGKQHVNYTSYEIPLADIGGAIDGDVVLIDTATKCSNTAKVVKVLERKLESIVGEVYRVGGSYFVSPIDKKKKSLTIALDGEAIEGERVSVELIQKSGDNFYVGKINRVFNHKDDPDEDILWEAFKCGIDDQFSKESLEQLEHIPNTVLDIDKVGRSDLTSWDIVTIDGEDTKDIDDALSIKVLDNGNYLVGVHIADVSYYVPKNSALDKDAFRKGTSNYLAGKVIPQFPHKLSNGICSLNPLVERLALSCIMEVNGEGKVVRYDIMPTVIKSRLKMTYTKVNDILKYNKVDPEYEKYEGMLKTLNKLALILRRNRFKEGAIEFDRPEVKLEFDSLGNVSGFGLRIQDLGENLIEEFMLLANEVVDTHLSKHGFPCLHRIHDKPNEDRLIEYFNLLSAVNFPFNKYDAFDCANKPKALQELAAYVKETGRLSNVLTTNLIRCMSRAKYSPNNIGHSGLAKEYYCHFTSPIRRYPDLCVHRIIKDCCFDSLNARRNAKRWEVELPEIGEHSSKMEKIADEAEQQTFYMRCSEYMKQFVGDEFEGTIIGLSSNGIQVQLDNMIEGKVKLKNMIGDYVYNPETYTLVSLDNRENYYIGDRLLLKLVDANKENKTIDFKVEKKLEENFIKGSEVSNRDIKIKTKMDKASREFYKK